MSSSIEVEEDSDHEGLESLDNLTNTETLALTEEYVHPSSEQENALHKAESDENCEEFSEFDKDQSALLQLNYLTEDGTQSVTNIREGAIRSEVERQKVDELGRHALELYIAKRDEDAKEKYNIIDEKWEYIQSLKDPLNIHNETMIQKEKCTQLLDDKDDVIEYLKNILREKDNAFLKEVEDQGLEVDILIDRIEQQISTLNEASSHHMEFLKEILNEERRIMIKGNRENFKSFIEEKEEVDKSYSEKLLSLINSHQRLMALIETEHDGLEKIIRSKLEKNINDLIVQNDSVRSQCILNEDKMNYNYMVLLKKKNENQIFSQYCKGNVTRLTRKLSSLKMKIEESCREISSKLVQNALLLDKSNNSIESIKERYEQLLLTNSKLYFDLWEFNKKEATALLQKIQENEKILYEEILRVPWSPPSRVHETLNPPSYEKASSAYLDHIKKRKLKNKPLLQANNQISDDRRKWLKKIFLDSLVYPYGFLIDHCERLTPSKTSIKDQKLVQFENLLKTIGVKSEKELDLLINNIAAYVKCVDCDQYLSQSGGIQRSVDREVDIKIPKNETFDFKAKEIGRRLEQCSLDHHQILIDEFDISKALINFTVTSKNRSENSELKDDYLLINMDPDEVTKFWDSYIDAVSPEDARLWETMLVAVQQYQKALQTRYNLNIEVKKLRSSNYEMRCLLQRFIRNQGKADL